MILLCDETIRKFLSKTIVFSDYEKQYKSLENRVILFINKLRSRIFKKKQIIKRFIQKIQYKKLINKIPCNECDLYTLEEYNTFEKNIYLIDVKLNKKWWFSIETITKLLCNNLSHFDLETYDILCKIPINPYTNKPLNIVQLLSIYDQLSKYNKVHKLIILFRLSNFSINKFLKMYNVDIINFSYKYNLESVDNNGLLIILNNIMYLNNIKYVNVNNLDLSINIIKEQSIKLIKECMFTYKKNQVIKIKKFIDNHKNIIRRASRNFTHFENNMELTDIDNDEDYNDVEDESFSWTTNESDDDEENDIDNLSVLINNLRY